MRTREMNTFRSFDGTTIAYHDDGQGPAVVLLHGFVLDAAGCFGHWEAVAHAVSALYAHTAEVSGHPRPVPQPPAVGAPGLAAALLGAGARVIAPDMRGHGQSDKPHTPQAYANRAMATDVLALLDRLKIASVDVLGYSMGAVTAVHLLALADSRIRSVVLAGNDASIVSGEFREFPKEFATSRGVASRMSESARCEEDATALESADASPGTVSSGYVLLANSIGADKAALAAVKRGHMADQVEPSALANVQIPVLVLVGEQDAAGHTAQRLAGYIPTARFATCEGDHLGALFEPSFQQAVVGFLHERWTRDGVRAATGVSP